MGVSTLAEASAALDRALGLNSRGRHSAARTGFDAVLAWCASAGTSDEAGAARAGELRHLLVRARIGLAVCHFEARGDVGTALGLLDDAATAACSCTGPATWRPRPGRWTRRRASSRPTRGATSPSCT